MNIFHKVIMQNMLKNRTRTLVTIIGVILSTAMIMAVATFAISLQNFMVKGSEQKYGDWHVAVLDAPSDFAEKQSKNKDVSETTEFANIGYGRLSGGKNPNKPYLFVAGFNQKTFETLPVKLLSGRLPKNNQEVVIPAHIAANGGVKYTIGETLSLSLGERMQGRKQLNQHDSYDHTQNNQENLTGEKKRSYTIVGICERPGFEEQSAPGYTLITCADNTEKINTFSVFVTLKNPRKARSYANDIAKNRSCILNDDVLRFLGASDDKVFNLLLYSIGAILVALIMLGSIFLIYNSFTISLNERMQQFGILSSVGATPKQLKNSVLFEGLCIGVLGIPIGILLGIGSIKLIIAIVAKNFNNLLYGNTPLVLVFSLPVMFAAVMISLITILISASIPAKKAANTPVMESIRQSNEIRIVSKDVRMTQFSKRIYGLEGTLALKNFKRNKRRYRTIIFSLALSVVLFVSARAFGSYLQDIAKQSVVDTDYDIVFSSSEMGEDELFRLYERFQKVEGITSSSYQAIVQYATQVRTNDFSSHYQKLLSQKSTKKQLSMDIQFIEDKEYLKFIKSLNLPVEEYTGENGKLIAVAKQRVKKADGKKELIDLFARDDLTLTAAPEISGKPAWDQQRNIKVTFADTYPMDTLPRQSSKTKSYVFMLVAPYQMKSRFSTKGITQDLGLTFLSKKSTRSTAEMKEIIEQEGITTQYDLYNVNEIFEQNRNTIFVVNIFSYVFIAMISLIAIANVFNTISTNIKLRRRELAMLRSVGMTDREFNKMMIFECIFYGSRSLILGIPTAGVLSWLIYRGMTKGGAEIAFHFPWGSLWISILGVFLIVVITMFYAIEKIKKENIIEALRDDLT
ncbi:MAG: ABC transporter permease [Enterococcus sp.]